MTKQQLDRASQPVTGISPIYQKLLAELADQHGITPEGFVEVLIGLAWKREQDAKAARRLMEVANRR